MLRLIFTIVFYFLVTALQASDSIKQVSAGGLHSLILKTDGTLYSTGNDYHGQLGDGTTDTRSTPIEIMSGVISIATGYYHSLILKSDGTLYSTGRNNFGQLGDGTTTSRSTPVLIMSGVSAISAGDYHSLILKSDGTLFSTGYNGHGQLGDGTIIDRSTPVQIMSDVSSIAAGYISLILKTDGTLFGAGHNSDGQLGDGTTTNRSTPVQIMSGVSAISTGVYHSLILKTDGTLFSTGRNTDGQLGDGSTNGSLTPIQVMSGVSAMDAGGYHSLILKTDGTLFSTGRNTDGQLGDGTTTNRSTPVQIMSGVSAVSTGRFHSLIIKTDETLFGTGYNTSGQLGNGTTTNSNSFIQTTLPVKTPPIITNISASTTNAITNESISFTSTVSDSDGTISSYSWNFGDGTTSTVETPSHSYTVAGTYTVTLTVTDNDSLTTSKTLEIIVNTPVNNPPTLSIASSATNILTDTSISFTSTASDSDGTIASYAWTFGDGGTSVEANPSYTYTTIGSYVVTLIITDNGGATTTQTISITVTKTNVLPSLTITSSKSSVATNESITFTSTATDSDGTIASYAWTFGDGGTSVEANPSHTYTTIGSYVATCIVTDSDGASTTKTVAITVSKANTAPTSTDLSTTTVTQTESVTLTISATDSDNDTLTYTIVTQPTLGTVSLSGSSATYTAGSTSSGSDSFTFKVYDGTEYSNISTVYLNVKEKTTPLVSTKTTMYFNADSSTSDKTLEVSGGIAPYTWSASVGSFEYISSNKDKVTYVPHSTIKTDDTITVKDSASTQQSLTITAKYISAMELTPDTRNIVKNEKTTFTIVGGTAPFTAVVTSGEADISISETSVNVTASKINSTVVIKVTDAAGATASKTINVVESFSVSPTTAYFDDFTDSLTITLNGGVSPYTAVAKTGTAIVSGSSVTFTPENRFSDTSVTITDSAGASKTVTIKVQNVSALAVSPSEPFTKPSKTIALSATLGSGSYTWSVDKGTLDTFKGDAVIYTAPSQNTIATVSVTDSSGGSAKSIITVSDGISITTGEIDAVLSIKEGWNLVSVPVKKNLVVTKEGDIPAIGSENMNKLQNYEFIYTYSSTTLKWIKDPSFISYSQGFWIKANARSITILKGEQYAPSLSGLTSDTWSLRGTGLDIKNVKTLYGLKSVWTYDASFGWSLDPETILAGQGFWAIK